MCNKNKIVLSAVAVLFMATILFSAIPKFEDNDMFTQAGSSNGYGQLVNMMIIAICAITFLVSLAYMASKLALVPEWEAYTKSELYQLLIGIIWGVFIFSSAIVIDEIVKNHISDLGSGYSGQTMFDISEKYLQDMICVSSSTTMKLEGIKLASQYLAGMKSRFYASSYGWGFAFPTFPGFDVIERIVDLIQMFISPFASSLIVQNLGLQIIHATALTIVLPTGIFMRFFSPTRDAGSFLIASALAFYFVLPFCYLINAQVMYQMYREHIGYNMCSGLESQTQDYLFAQKSFDQDYYSRMTETMLPSLSRDFLDLSFEPQKYGIDQGYGALKKQNTVGFTAHLSYVVFQAVFLPAVNMIMVVTFVKAGVKFFSQNMNE